MKGPSIQKVFEPRQVFVGSVGSRVRNGIWEYNESHRDYQAAAAMQAGRLRYLVQLFAKELVIRTFGGPADEQLLEPADLRQTFNDVDTVAVSSGSQVYVFNIQRNEHRLIAAIHFDRGRVYVLRVLTHKDYDKQRWKDEL
jgi:mRNA-degrading endonuclease HigB of HigAB toxin-antitoxin module